MPHYYFNLINRHGRSLQDEHGENFPNDGAALRHAGAIARDLSGQNGSAVFQHWSIEVLDSERHRLLGAAVAELATKSK